jgi:hypothetical protein
MDTFSWLWFFFLVFITIDFARALNLRDRHLMARRSEDDDGVISRKARGAIDRALVHWRLVQKQGDVHWEAAFTVLGEVLNTEGNNNVRLYMYTLANDAAEFYQAYEAEIYD